MKTWLKGGIWSILVVLLISILLSLMGIWNSSSALSLIDYLKIFLLPGILLLLPFMFSNLSEGFSIFITGLTSLIVWFLIGALIGWIIGKIKSRGDKNE